MEGCWVFRAKRDLKEEIVRYKACKVVKSHHRKYITRQSGRLYVLPLLAVRLSTTHSHPIVTLALCAIHHQLHASLRPDPPSKAHKLIKTKMQTIQTFEPMAMVVLDWVRPVTPACIVTRAVYILLMVDYFSLLTQSIPRNKW